VFAATNTHARKYTYFLLGRGGLAAAAHVRGLNHCLELVKETATQATEDRRLLGGRGRRSGSLCKSAYQRVDSVHQSSFLQHFPTFP